LGENEDEIARDDECGTDLDDNDDEQYEHEIQPEVEENERRLNTLLQQIRDWKRADTPQ
jgi:hypothetical protein